MSRREEFDRAVAVIQKALVDGIVTMGLTTTPQDRDPIVREIVIDSFGKPKATYYYETTDSYGTEATARGTQSNFELGILEQDGLNKRNLERAKREYDKAMRETTAHSRDFHAGQAKLNALEAEIIRLGSKK